MPTKKPLPKPKCRANHRSRSISLPNALHERVENIAGVEQRSYNSCIAEAVTEFANKWETAKLEDKLTTGKLRK